MIKKNKYPKIEPHFLKDKSGKVTDILLPYNVYESINSEIKELKIKIKELQKKSKKH